MASEQTNVILLVGNVTDPTAVQQADGNNPPFTQGRQGDQICSEMHGKFWTANYRNKVFEVNATSVTVPVNAGSLVSVFTLYNPPTSNVMCEMIDTTVGQSLAATVVTGVWWVAVNTVLTSKSSAGAAGTVQSGRAMSNASNQVVFHTAWTFSGTPTLIDMIGSFGATTNATSSVMTKFYDGRLIVPPGIAIAIATDKAALTSSGTDLEARWCEWPL